MPEQLLRAGLSLLLIIAERQRLVFGKRAGQLRIAHRPQIEDDGAAARGGRRLGDGGLVERIDEERVESFAQQRFAQIGLRRRIERVFGKEDLRVKGRLGQIATIPQNLFLPERIVLIAQENSQFISHKRSRLPRRSKQARRNVHAREAFRNRFNL